ncbi:MAG: hypothetical protein IPL65_07535 [Lewinellaceae bacterium]|nr:hypothetical protein [Lewinellaceae bacterium]
MIKIPSFLPKGTRLFSFYLPIYFLIFSQFFQSSEFKPAAQAAQKVHTAAVPTASKTVAAISVVASSNTPICTGTTLNLTATVSGGTGPYTYIWSGPQGFTSTQQNPARTNVALNHAGTYSVTVTETSTNMTAIGSTNVTIEQGPSANAGPDQYKCINTNAVLAGSFGGTASSAIWSASPNVGTFLPNNTTMNANYIPPVDFEGTVTLTLTTDDPVGLCAAASDQMTISWENTGSMVCDDLLNLSLGDNCSVVVTPDIALEGNVLDPLYVVEVFLPNGVSIGNTVTAQYIGVTLTVKVTDICNNNMCSTFMTVSDMIPPKVIDCSDVFLSCAITNFSAAYLYNTLGITNAYPTVTDNCGPYTQTYVDTWVDLNCGDSFNGYNDLSGYVKREWTFKDPYNNTSTCTQYLYFERLHIADITLPQDVTISCTSPNTDPSNTGAPSYQAYNHIFPLFPGNTYCELSVSHSDQNTNLCGGTRAIIRTWTIYDFCVPVNQNPPNQNPLTYVQIINISDSQGPVIDCPDDLTVNMDALTCCAQVNLPSAVIADNCSKVKDATVTITTTNPFTNVTTTLYTGTASLMNYPGSGLHDTLAVFSITSCLPPGIHQVTYTAEDQCGNISTCTFDLTIVDNVPPVAACDQITKVALGSDGMIFVNAFTFDDGSYDNCGMVYFKARRKDSNGCQGNNFFYDQVKFCCEDVGDTISVILRVYDVPVPPGAVNLAYQEEHSNECEVQVYVEDRLKPVCIPPASVTVSCENFDPTLWAYGNSQAIDNCCIDTAAATVTTNYSNFDTTCNRGTITRNFKVYDCHGNSNQCTQKIVVNYEQDFYVKFPNDMIVNECNGTGIYGEPTFFGEDCELLAVSFQDQVFTVVPDACFKIERTRTIINWCTYDPNLGCQDIPNPNPNAISNHPSNLPGPIVSAAGTPAAWAPTVAKLSPNDATPTNFSTFWNPYTNCYRYKQIIKIIDNEAPVFDNCPDSTVTFCDITNNDPNLWNENYWYDPAINSQDMCEGPADITITGTDSCSGKDVNFRYLLFLDLDNDGTMETVVNSANFPPANTVNYNNYNTPNYSGGVPRAFDKRNVAASQKYRFAIETFVNGNSKSAAVRWNTTSQPNAYVVPQLPYGTHKIKWFIADGCGNENACEYTFVVKDCAAPSVTCLNGLSVNIMPTGMISMNVAEFVQHAEDNCTPTPLLVYSIRKLGTGTGFPVDGNGDPITTVAYTCADLGLQGVEIWAMDAAGNADHCDTYVIVQDNAGNCNPSANVSVAGALITEDYDGVEDGQVEIQGFDPAGPLFNYYQMSGTNGDFLFSNAVPMYSNYTVVPSKDDNPLNGVSTYDLVLISQHILGLEPLNSPYKMIAADANKGGSMRTLDIVDLRRVILGITNELPNNNQAWRFVDKSFAFPDPLNPFSTPFAESKTVASILASQMDDDFVAIKVGDVNGTAIPNTMMQSDDRSAGTLLFDVDDRKVEKGEEFTVMFRATEAVLGYQFTLLFPNLDLVDIKPGLDMAYDNFGIFNDEHLVTTSFYGKGSAAFEMKFIAKDAGQLSQMLSVSSKVTKAEAYNADRERLDVAFRFKSDGASTLVGVGFELYQNIPNPFINKTMIGFHLPEATDATLSIYDEVGRVLYTTSGAFSKGYNTIAIESSLLNSTGLLYYKMETVSESAVRTMIRMQ